jgi:hypothetical protein
MSQTLYAYEPDGMEIVTSANYATNLQDEKSYPFQLL